MTGGLIYSARSWKLEIGRRYTVVLMAMAIAVAPLIAVHSLAAVFGLSVLAGLALAPMISCQFSLVGALAPAGHRHGGVHLAPRRDGRRHGGWYGARGVADRRPWPRRGVCAGQHQRGVGRGAGCARTPAHRTHGAVRRSGGASGRGATRSSPPRGPRRSHLQPRQWRSPRRQWRWWPRRRSSTPPRGPRRSHLQLRRWRSPQKRWRRPRRWRRPPCETAGVQRGAHGHRAGEAREHQQAFGGAEEGCAGGEHEAALARALNRGDDVGGEDDAVPRDGVGEVRVGHVQHDPIAPAQLVDVAEGLEERGAVPGDRGRAAQTGKASCPRRRSACRSPAPSPVLRCRCRTPLRSPRRCAGCGCSPPRCRAPRGAEARAARKATRRRSSASRPRRACSSAVGWARSSVCSAPRRWSC